MNIEEVEWCAIRNEEIDQVIYGYDKLVPNISFAWHGMSLNWPPRGEWFNWIPVKPKREHWWEEKRAWFVLGPLSVNIFTGQRRLVCAKKHHEEMTKKVKEAYE